MLTDTVPAGTPATSLRVTGLFRLWTASEQLTGVRFPLQPVSRPS